MDASPPFMYKLYPKSDVSRQEARTISESRAGFASCGHNALMSKEQEFSVRSVLDDHVATVTVGGELDLATKPALLGELRSAVAEGATEIVVDISGLSFVDSSGVGAFLEARQLGASVLLRNPTGRVRKLLELVLIDSIVPIEYVGDDEGDAAATPG